MTEKDPLGKKPSDPGAKLDDGKVMAHLLQQFSRALMAVAEVSTFGANKYSIGGWQEVENGAFRYSNAMMRHYLKEALEDVDPDSGLLHEAHLAWNALARLELKLRELSEDEHVDCFYKGGAGCGNKRLTDKRYRPPGFCEVQGCQGHTFEKPGGGWACDTCDWESRW